MWKKHNIYSECLFLISTIQTLDSIWKHNISKLQPDLTVAGRENSQRGKLSRSVFSQKFSSGDISQTRTDIENPSSENVHDIEENNISKYRYAPTVDGGVIVVRCSAINMSSLQPLCELSLALASHSKRKNRMIFIVLSSC